MGRNKGTLITFEGIEGSGKSTVIREIACHLKKKKYTVIVLREPGGTKIGEKIRKILLDKKNAQMSVECELMLYNAARVQLIKEIILPALKKGQIVLCDRFTDSTIAYQSYGGRLEASFSYKINNFATLGLKPHMTFLLDSNVRAGLKRSGRGDRIELKSLTFHNRVRKGFLALARKERKRFHVIRDGLSIAEIVERVKRKIDVVLS